MARDRRRAAVMIGNEIVGRVRPKTASHGSDVWLFDPYWDWVPSGTVTVQADTCRQAQAAALQIVGAHLQARLKSETADASSAPDDASAVWDVPPVDAFRRIHALRLDVSRVVSPGYPADARADHGSLAYHEAGHVPLLDGTPHGPVDPGLRFVVQWGRRSHVVPSLDQALGWLEYEARYDAPPASFDGDDVAAWLTDVDNASAISDWGKNHPDVIVAIVAAVGPDQALRWIDDSALDEWAQEAGYVHTDGDPPLFPEHWAQLLARVAWGHDPADRRALQHELLRIAVPSSAVRGPVPCNMLSPLEGA